MKNTNEKEQYPSNYRIIFETVFESEMEIQEIKNLLDENAEINELCQSIIDTTEPAYTFGITSSLEPVQNYKITPIFTNK
jgi:hypothetical protein